MSLFSQFGGGGGGGVLPYKDSLQTASTLIYPHNLSYKHKTKPIDLYTLNSMLQYEKYQIQKLLGFAFFPFVKNRKK